MQPMVSSIQKSLTAICLTVVLFSACRVSRPSQADVHPNAFCFYYNWYGSTAQDGQPYHWAHPVLKKGPLDTVTRGFIPGGENISSNYFPQLGAYSSTNKQVIQSHIRMMKQAGIGVIVLTWWNTHDFGYKSVPTIMNEAAAAGLKVCFHIEPFTGRNAQTTKDNIRLIIDSYGSHPALYKINNKPLFFVYDSYLTPAAEWATLLHPQGSISIRNTPYDAVMIGLWVNKNEQAFFQQSGFDGFYTYFGATGFTYGSTPDNWRYLQQWAGEHKKIFIPSVAPGYIDARVRPWNGINTRDRENGKYYDRMFEAAIQSGAEYIGITSFNEWHEGTQIEPAIPFSSPHFNYQNYLPLAPDYYLKRTAWWLNQWRARQKK